MGVVERDYNFSAGATVVADQIDTDLDTLYAEFNGGIDSDNFADSAVTDSKMDVAVRQSTSRNETGIGNFVYTGMLGSTSVSLIVTLTAGTAYSLGYRIAKSSTQITLTASKDNYIDLDRDGSYQVTPVANGSAAPSVYANSIRIGKAVTNSTTVTSYTDLATRSNAQSPPRHRIKDADVRYLSTTQIKVMPGIVEIAGTNYTNTTSTAVTVTGNQAWLTGSAAASTHVYVYAQANSAGTFDVKLSSIAPNKTDTAGNANGEFHYLLNGGTYYRFLGHCRLNASVLYPFSTQGGEDVIEIKYWSRKSLVSAGTASTWAAKSVSQWVPALTNVHVEVGTSNTSGSANSVMALRRTSSGETTGRVYDIGNNTIILMMGTVELNGSQSFDYRFASGDTGNMYLYGFEFRR